MMNNMNPEMNCPGMPCNKKMIFSHRAKMLFICFGYCAMAAMTLMQ